MLERKDTLMPIEIELIEVQNVLIVAVTGEVNSVTAIQLGEQLQQTAKQGKNQVVLDLSQVTYLSSAGLREVISGVQRAKENGGDLRIANPSARVVELLDMTGLNKALGIYATRDEAVQSFA